MYEFVSVGVRKITKHVEFIPTETENIISVGFGDLLETGHLSDKVNSNNGDLPKVIATIINIIEQYLLINPQIKIYFRGSTPQRTRLYGSYYAEFTSADFVITALTTENLEEVAFNPSTPYIYQVYFIQNKC